MKLSCIVRRDVEIGVLFFRVRIVDGDARHELAQLRVFRYLWHGVVTQEDQINCRLVNVYVGDVVGDKGSRLQWLDARIADYHPQFVHIFRFKVELPVDGDDAVRRSLFLFTAKFFSVFWHQSALHD